MPGELLATLGEVVAALEEVTYGGAMAVHAGAEIVPNKVMEKPWVLGELVVALEELAHEGAIDVLVGRDDSACRGNGDDYIGSGGD